MQTKTLSQCLALALLASTAAFAQPPQALLTQSVYAVSWQVFEPHARLELTVVGPEGRLLRKSFDDGVPAEVDVAELARAGSADSTYSWQLEVVPRVPAAVRKALQEAREGGDEAAVARLVAGINPGRVESGGFTVRGGTLVDPDATAPRRATAPTLRERSSTLAERVYPVADDLVVIGSACIGADCEFSDTFSGEALKLKSYTPRLRFEDTSFAPGNPNEDWELVINEEGSTVLDRFAIKSVTNGNVPLTVRYGAPSDSLYVDPSGKVGLKTATPVKDLHLASASSPTIRLEQNTTGGLPAQSWELGGNELGFFLVDVTNSARVPFRVAPGAPANSVFVNQSGRLGVGTGVPDLNVDARSVGATTVGATAFSDTSRPGLVLRRTRGGQPTPTFVLSNDMLGALSWRSWNGTTFTNDIASIDARAEENFTATANGTRLIFQTTPNGTTTPTTRLTIRQNGRVGVGTSSPTELLHVNGGNILISGGGFFDDGVPVTDFVFEPDYRLMPLDELRTFVTTHKHLPNVPSKDDAKAAGGVNLGVYSMRLLEKVEELTLYTLDQHAQIQALERRNAELEARLARLEAALAGPAARE